MFNTFSNELSSMVPSEITTLGVSVSGGGDSMALLYLARKWCQIHNKKLMALTVDHDLRQESADEAAFVKQWCLDNNVEHETFIWKDNNQAGNMQNHARQARLEFIDQWRFKNNIKYVMVGHSKSDQAETVVMRLVRGSGVDGLAGIQKKRKVITDNGFFYIVRPIMEFSRKELRDYCSDNVIKWFDDPSNENRKYTRVKVRKLIEELDINEDGLIKTASRMSRALTALEDMTDMLEKFAVEGSGDKISISLPLLMASHREIQMRLLSRLLSQVSGVDYRPRENALEMSLDSILSGKGSTLHKCILKVKKDRIYIQKEIR